MNEQEWHEWRRQGIGGSDIGVLFGESQYCTPLELYRLKVGETKPEPTNALAQLGKDNESNILDWFENKWPHGFKLIRNIQSKRQGWIRGNFDSYGVENLIPVDAKYSNSNGWGNPGTDQVPIGIFLQMHWYLIILDKAPEARVIKRNPLTGEFDVYFIQRDDNLEAHIKSVAYHFWHNHVLKKIPPKNTIYGTESINKKVARLRKINEKLKPLKKNKEELTAEIKEFMRQHEFLISPDSDKITKYTNCDKEKFDKDQFKLDYPDLYGQYVTKTKQRSLYA